MTQSIKEARACFIRFLPSINVLRSYCSYKPLAEESFPDSSAELIDWMSNKEFIKDFVRPVVMRSLLSQISYSSVKRGDNCAFLAPKPASPGSLFPESSKPQTTAESYRRLYDLFLKFLQQIPEPLCGSWETLLDHFDSAWAAVAINLPSPGEAVFDQSVSLYDVSKAQVSVSQSEKILLIQGDFQGIQNFIFTEGSQTNKKSSKLLRGRSFYVSLITELAALKISETLGLPPLSPVMNAAGKFLIAAPYSEENLQKIEMLRQEFDDWFLENTLGTASLAVSCTEASQQEVLGKSFSNVMKRVFESTERAKLENFRLPTRNSPILQAEYPNGVSPYDQRLPAGTALSADEIKIGDLLVKSDALLITKGVRNSPNALKLPIFGYFVSFARKKDLTKSDFETSVRIWDTSIAEQMDEVLFKGLAKRFFNSYVSRFTYEGEANDPRYKSAQEDVQNLGDIKPFSFLACDNVSSDGEGIIALGALKGDIDNLGLIFREGTQSRFNASTLAATMCLSRQVNNFFAVYLPVLFAQKYVNTYTVFAGGDDFFLIGPWHDICELAGEIRDKFARYCLNPNIHFSAGISVVKPSVPVRTIGRMAEFSLEQSKDLGKDRVTAYGVTVEWRTWKELVDCEKNLNFMRADYDISVAYLYRLLSIIDLYEKRNSNPLASIWRARLFYTTVRFVKDKNFDGEKVRDDFLPFIANSLEKFGKAFTIPLFNSLYMTRKTGN